MMIALEVAYWAINATILGAVALTIYHDVS